jgi:hypothetical protein
MAVYDKHKARVEAPANEALSFLGLLLKHFQNTGVDENSNLTTGH